MTDDKEEKELQYVDDKFVKEYSVNSEVIKFIKSKFSRMSKVSAVNLIRMLLWKQIPIRADQIISKSKSFVRYNLGKFDDNNNLKIDDIKSLRRELNGFLLEIGKDIPQYEVDKNPNFKVKTIDGQECYVLDKMTMFKKVRQLVCDEGGDVHFKYNFKKSDMDIGVPINKDVLQRSYVQILSDSIKFDYPVEYIYPCPKCGGSTTKKAYEVAGTNGRILCPETNYYLNPEGESRARICNMSLNPDNEISITKDAYYYDICYEDDAGKKHSAGMISFDLNEPGFYECVLFRIKNPRKTELYQVMDVKGMTSNKFSFPSPVKDENYVFTLQKAFDKFIKKQTGMEIYALIPIKCALILQTVVNNLGMSLNNNIQIIGDPAVGKSLVLKFYSFLLNGSYNLSTNGLSISIPGLRGTKQSITLMGKEQKIITTGHLGTYKSIHIDEAGENRELIQNLKTFLLEENYGYDKAGATGAFNRRTAHINISENLDYAHLGQYRGTIRKAYKEMTTKIGDEEKEVWNEDWDLHLPLFKYNNLYLYKIIKEKRTEYKLKQIWWVDNYEYALHERFPFYFYLVNEKKDEKLAQIVKDNTARDIIKENLNLMKVLKSNDIQKFFKQLSIYKNSDSDRLSFVEVDKILEEYGIQADVRMKEFFYNLIKISRIINQRKKVEKEDFDLLKYMLEKMNCKLDVVETVDYEIAGPPDLGKKEAMETKIEEETKESDGQFGMPEGEF